MDVINLQKIKIYYIDDQEHKILDLNDLEIV